MSPSADCDGSRAARLDTSPRGQGDGSQEASGDTSPPSPPDGSPPGGRDTSAVAEDLHDGSRRCRWCHLDLSATLRRDALHCSKSHRQAHHRFGRAIQVATAADRPLRLAYGDPPYQGKARRYYKDHPDYAGEVDHQELLSRLQERDGWALSASAASLPFLLALCTGIERLGVASWVRGHRSSRSTRPVSTWEPVIYVPARHLVSATPVPDALVYTARARRSDPAYVTGAKPAAFCSWLFGLLGAAQGDTFDDLYPGSGGVGRAWELFQGRR